MNRPTNEFSRLLYDYMRATDFLIQVIIAEAQNGKIPASVALSAAEVSKHVIEMEKYVAVKNERSKK